MYTYHASFEDKSYELIERTEIELLLQGIYTVYGYDFREYSYASIRRRILHRLSADKLKSISALQERVLRDRSSLKRLLDDFSVNVTEMFRDPEFYSAFRSQVIPELRDMEQIRFWLAGCSTGEEAISIAILMQEEGLLHKTRIYATDMNEAILERAKQGKFEIDKMKQFTKNYIAFGGKRPFSEYYYVQDDEVCFDPDLLKHIVFFHHNLVTDQSFNEFQVIICRNVLIYFNESLQKRVFQLFYQSLCTGGFLGLGSKETLPLHYRGAGFEELNYKWKLYIKKG